MIKVLVAVIYGQDMKKSNPASLAIAVTAGRNGSKPLR
jgi:hypothetical protein